MKKSLLVAALLLTGMASFAQKTSAFDRVAFDALMNRYAQDPVKFLKTEAAPDFVLATADGASWNTERTIGLYERNTQTGRSYENVAIRQYGNTGVATGILTHSYVGKASGKPSQLREFFTYVFNSPKPGQWQMVSAHHSTASAGTLAENEEAIKKVIEGLTTAAYTGDGKTYLNYWADAPYISRAGSYPSTGVTKVTGDTYRKQMQEALAKPSEPSKDKVTRDNWLIRVNGNSAFVVFDQHNARPDGTTRHSVEERYLERMNGEWKLVNVTVLVEK